MQDLVWLQLDAHAAPEVNVTKLQALLHIIYLCRPAVAALLLASAPLQWQCLRAPVTSLVPNIACATAQ